MESNNIKKVSAFGIATALVLSSFLSILPVGRAYAGITDGQATNSRTTFEKTETTSENIPFGTDPVSYIEGKKAEWQNSTMGQGVTEEYRAGWEALFVADSATNTYQYPVWLSTYFNGVSLSGESCPGSGDAILIGDVDDIIGSVSYNCTATYLYSAHYREVTAVPTSFTVKFDTGSVLPDRYKLVDQTVAVGESISEPTNTEGTSLNDFLDYCRVGYDRKCYSGYKLEGFYTDPEFNTLYNNNPINSNTTLYAKWVDEYEGYERITDIDLIVTPPEAGTVITSDEGGNPWETQSPQLEVTLPSGIKYRLYDDDGYNYAYWLKGNTIEDYEPFTGVLEKGGKYYVEVWLKVKEGELAIFGQNPTVKVNGVVVPLMVSDYGVNDIAVIIEVTPQAEEESSNTAAPNSGVFTATSSVTPTISGAAIIAIITLSIAFTLSRRKASDEE